VNRERGRFIAHPIPGQPGARRLPLARIATLAQRIGAALVASFIAGIGLVALEDPSKERGLDLLALRCSLNDRVAVLALIAVIGILNGAMFVGLLYRRALEHRRAAAKRL